MEDCNEQRLGLCSCSERCYLDTVPLCHFALTCMFMYMYKISVVLCTAYQCDVFVKPSLHWLITIHTGIYYITYIQCYFSYSQAD